MQKNPLTKREGRFSISTGFDWFLDHENHILAEFPLFSLLSTMWKVDDFVTASLSFLPKSNIVGSL